MHSTGRPDAEAAGREDDRSGRPSVRRWIGPSLVVLGAIIAAYLLYRTLSRYTVDELVASVLAVPLFDLGLAVLWAAASYATLTLSDWLALRHVGRPLSYPKAALVSFVSLSIGHNLGFAAVSSGAVRYRFYSQAGLDGREVANVIVFCGMTIVLGLSTLGGLALLLHPEFGQDMMKVGRPVALVVATAALAVPLAYVLAAWISGGRISVWRWSLPVPSPKLALAQLAVGLVNFLFVSACLYQVTVALADVSYFSVASAYVVANIAAIITHAPGGVGVIESVLLLLLPGAELIGAVLVFRFVYFLIPLFIGGPLFLVLELRKGALALRSKPEAANA